MQIREFDETGVEAGTPMSAANPIDPLDPDRFDDQVVVTTRRGLVRMALVAAETASRFSRENASVDPVAWMMAPRLLFSGLSALDACLDREQCLRAVLLHGLSIGMDADPAFVDSLIDEVDHGEDASSEDGDFAVTDPGCGPRLWTSILVDGDEFGIVQAFDAVVSAERGEAEARLCARHGAASACGLMIREGFDANLPLAEALVSPALADMLEQVAADPSSPLAAGLSVSIKQRFAA